MGLDGGLDGSLDRGGLGMKCRLGMNAMPNLRQEYTNSKCKLLHGTESRVLFDPITYCAYP